MIRLFVSLFVCLVAVSSVSAAGPSGYRAALLLGNWKYDEFTVPGVGKSLDHLEQQLTSQDYFVTRRENLGEKEQKEAVEEFAKSVPTGGVALVYFAGLGAHVERFGEMHNLLRPVGEKIENENDYRSRGLNVTDDLLETLDEQSGARVNLVFLDACWQSPIKPDNEKVGGGMIEFEPGPDTMVMFAADSTQTLPVPEGDGPSRLSKALAQHVGQLEASLTEASEAIAAETDGAWVGGATQAGIGERSELPVTDELHEGKTPGEGFVNSIGMTFRWCPPGSFTMGSEQMDTAATADRKPVKVTLSKGFWMGQHEVTQREYDIVRRKTVPRGFTQHKNAPFWGINETKHVTEFCEELSKIERKAGTLPDGWEYACPTEAEWEYACRAGSASAFCFGDSISELGRYANFADKALREANPNYYWAVASTDDGVAEALAPVGSYRPNAWGLRDMHGNVAEIVADHLTPERPGGTDPLVRVEKDGQTQIRGGAWCSLPLYCESSFRNTPPGRDKHNFVGFRVVLKKVK